MLPPPHSSLQNDKTPTPSAETVTFHSDQSEVPSSKHHIYQLNSSPMQTPATVISPLPIASQNINQNNNYSNLRSRKNRHSKTDVRKSSNQQIDNHNQNYNNNHQSFYNHCNPDKVQNTNTNNNNNNTQDGANHQDSFGHISVASNQELKYTNHHENNNKNGHAPQSPSKIAVLKRRVTLSARRLVKAPVFEYTILFMILGSTVALCLDDVNLPKRPKMKTILDILEIIFTVVFTIEMLLKFLAYGLKVYSAFKRFGPAPKFGNFWRFSE